LGWVELDRSELSELRDKILERNREIDREEKHLADLINACETVEQLEDLAKIHIGHDQ
jgi:hypothetical protein